MKLAKCIGYALQLTKSPRSAGKKKNKTFKLRRDIKMFLASPLTYVTERRTGAAHACSWSTKTITGSS